MSYPVHQLIESLMVLYIHFLMRMNSSLTKWMCKEAVNCFRCTLLDKRVVHPRGASCRSQLSLILILPQLNWIDVGWLLGRHIVMFPALGIQEYLLIYRVISINSLQMLYYPLTHKEHLRSYLKKSYQLKSCLYIQ